jgi:hypothetical protein
MGDANRPPGNTAAVDLSLLKSQPVTGMQFELRYPVGSVSTAGAVVLGGLDHAAFSHDLGPGLQRVVVISRTNAEMPAGLRVVLGLVYGHDVPAGGPSLQMQNLLFTDATGESLSASARYTRLEQFRRDHFSLAERDDPAVVGDDRDPDQDGLSNLAEAFAGRSPRLPQPAGRWPSRVERDGQGRIFLALRFVRTRDEALRSEIDLVAEAGESIPGWTVVPVPILPTGQGDAQSEEVEARLETTGHDQHFLHLYLRRRSGP